MDSLARLVEIDAARRLMARDATLFADPAIAAGRLGWIGLPEAAARVAADFMAIGASAAAAGMTDVVLLGMGGSSLAPLVLSRAIPPAPGHPALHVLDTTSPAQVRACLDDLDPSSTLVIVSSKSGTSVEPLSLHGVFRAWMVAALGEAAAEHFIAITDPGTPLDSLATKEFGMTILAPADVGGRYAALTPFATFPGALIGVDVERLAATARDLEEACAAPGDDNPALALSAWLSDAYAGGRDKVTIVCSPEVESFGLWVEQLIAESTGKDCRGLFPVLEASPGLPGSHGSDRMTFVLRFANDDALSGLSARLPDGEPVFEVVIDDPYAIGAEFVHWEWAVALFSALNGIECFDQPDVESAKAATRAILAGTKAAPRRTVLDSGVALAGSMGIEARGLDEAVADLLARVPDHGYLAVLAYLPEDEQLLGPLRAACAGLSAASGIPVTLELGPRYLHSTGQFHKGGPAVGAFLFVTVTDTDDLPLPGQDFTLAELHAAQPAGDVAALVEKGRPVLEVVLPATSHVNRVADALTCAIGT